MLIGRTEITFNKMKHMDFPASNYILFIIGIGNGAWCGYGLSVHKYGIRLMVRNTHYLISWFKDRR